VGELLYFGAAKYQNSEKYTETYKSIQHVTNPLFLSLAVAFKAARLPTLKIKRTPKYPINNCDYHPTYEGGINSVKVTFKGAVLSAGIQLIADYWMVCKESLSGVTNSPLMWSIA